MTDSDAVDRMFRALVREIRASRPELLEESFSVAEIYQNLVPYRTHRDVIGTEMSGDYEHVLMRLLAGEGDYVTLESDAARRKLLHELDSIHPDTGLYRDYAACEVRLNEDQLPELDGVADHDGGNGSGPGHSESTDPGTGDQEGPEEQEAKGEHEPRGQGQEEENERKEPQGGTSTGIPREPVLFQSSSEEGDAEPTGDETCRWCQGALPRRDDLQYCPHCGSHVDVRPCPGCGAEVEAGWRYCVACGAEVEG